MLYPIRVVVANGKGSNFIISQRRQMVKSAVSNSLNILRRYLQVGTGKAGRKCVSWLVCLCIKLLVYHRPQVMACHSLIAATNSIALGHTSNNSNTECRNEFR
jgi:hypothetical protein